jgi:hypothetical protein
MAKEVVQEPCPYCRSPAVVIYVRQKNGVGEVVAEYRDAVQCSNTDCPGEKS